MKRDKGIHVLFRILMLAALIIGCFGCSSSDNDAEAVDTRTTAYQFWSDIAGKAVAQSVDLLNREAGRAGGKPEMTILSNGGYAVIEGQTTQACLDGLREAAGVSEGKKTLLSVHSAVNAPLWFFVMDNANGNGVYCEVDPKALDLIGWKVSGELFGVQNLRNVRADKLLSDLPGANESIFNAEAFSGNEFRIIGIANLLLKDAPYDLVRAVQYHDHYCPGVTSGYYLVRYLENNLPLTDEYGSYFVLSIPPWCKDDALITLLNATPGKKGYGVFYLDSPDTAALSDEAKNLAGVFFRWNGNADSPAGEGIALSFDFSEAKEACNWGEKTPWNWWESRLKMDLWYLDYLDTPERFVQTIPIKGKAVFSLKDISGIAKPTDLARPGVNPLSILGLLRSTEQEYSLWRAIGRRAADEALALMTAKGASPASQSLIALTNAGYAEIDGRTTAGCLDGLREVAGVSRGRNTLLEIHSLPGKPLYFALYDPASGWCAYLEVDPVALDGDPDPATIAASDLFSIMNVANIQADYLCANAAESAQRFDAGIFGGNEFAVVTIANTAAAGAPSYAVRAFEFHDHYCPGVTSGIMMAQYIKENLPMQTPQDSYFVQGVQPWCKEDALMVMLNATPGKGGYAVTYPTDADKAAWLPEAQGAVNIIYRKNGDTGRWDGLVLGFQWGETGCPTTGSSVIDKLCTDLWYLDRLDASEDFVTVIRAFELPEGVGPKDYARPGVDPMAMLGLGSSTTE